MMLIFLLSLTGIPPTGGFIGKYFLFAAAVQAGWTWVAVVAVLMSAVSLYYYFRIVMYMYQRDRDRGDAGAAAGAGAGGRDRALLHRDPDPRDLSRAVHRVRQVGGSPSALAAAPPIGGVDAGYHRGRCRPTRTTRRAARRSSVELAFASSTCPRSGSRSRSRYCSATSAAA